MKRFLTIVFAISNLYSKAQILPPERSVDWTLAGLRDTTTIGFTKINMEFEGVKGDSTSSNDSIFYAHLDSSDSFIRIVGSQSSAKQKVTLPASKGAFSIGIENGSWITPNSWLRISQNDADLVTSNWALGTVGQIAQVASANMNAVVLKSPLRKTYELSDSARIQAVNPIENVGIECLKIHRLDDTAPAQTSSILFNYAANCWVKGVESENCTFSHVDVRASSNISITKNYFHHAFDYGSGGRAYGTMVHLTSNECLIEDNVFERLRHAMILQAGANGNVFTYNYAFDAYWTGTSLPEDSSGDMVLHGNYPYSNLFEQNIGENIVIDNSHGANGPHNTIFRNRGVKFGIFFSDTTSPNQNIIGNEITNRTLPYSIVNYFIQGRGHFLHGNNNKQTIDPVGTDSLPDESYAYASRPNHIEAKHWASIGTPNAMSSGTISAKERFEADALFEGICSDTSTNTSIENLTGTMEDVVLYPNPASSTLNVKTELKSGELTVVNTLGVIVYQIPVKRETINLNIEDWPNGLYFIVIQNGTNRITKTFCKQ